MTGARTITTTNSSAGDRPKTQLLAALRDATLNRTYVSMGSRRTSTVHEFYRYPARFSPAFARAAIEAFSEPGSLVVDPFVGGGTTVVEARLAGRLSIGSDLNGLAVFVARTKATTYDQESLHDVRQWGEALSKRLNIHGPVSIDPYWAESGYFRNLSGRDTWRLRKLIGQALGSLYTLPTEPTRDFGRLAVLRTAQWALDMRSELPNVADFRQQLASDVTAMSTAAERFSDAVNKIDGDVPASLPRTVVLHLGVPGLAGHRLLTEYPKPALVLTSPPYPGVYVLYHRWKLQGRKETPAPFWIADCPDGNGHSYYTMRARSRPTLDSYFDQLRGGFQDIAKCMGPETWVVQMVGFNDPEVQLHKYLAVMEAVGLEEVRFDELATADDGRLWRTVPSRRWWVVSNTRRSTAPHTAQEVVLVHRLRR